MVLGILTVIVALFATATSLIGFVPFKTLTMRITLGSLTVTTVVFASATSTLGMVPLTDKLQCDSRSFLRR